MDMLQDLEFTEPATTAVVNSLFEFSANGRTLITMADAILDNFRWSDHDEEKENSAVTPQAPEKRAGNNIKDKQHILRDVRIVLKRRALQKLSDLQEHEIPDDFSSTLPSDKTVRTLRGTAQARNLREWAGISVRFPVNEEKQVLDIPYQTYDDPFCPPELKQLLDMFPEVMAERPCDCRISVRQNADQQNIHGSGSGSSSKNLPASFAPAVAVVFPCTVEHRSALIFEVRPTVYQESMDMKVGWDYDRGMLAIKFSYDSDVMSSRPASLGGETRFTEVLKDYLGHGWGQPSTLGSRFQATHWEDILPHLNEGERLYCRDPEDGKSALEVSPVPSEKLFILKLYLGEEASRTGILWN